LIKPILANEKFNTKTRLDNEGKKWKFSGLVDLSFLPFVIGCHKHELVEEEDRVGALWYLIVENTGAEHFQVIGHDYQSLKSLERITQGNFQYVEKSIISDTLLC
jgi:hypothetical protein